jgi:hypothetical protein
MATIREKLDLIREGALMEGFNDGSMELYEMSRDISSIGNDLYLMNEGSGPGLIVEYISKAIEYLIKTIDNFFATLKKRSKARNFKQLLDRRKQIAEWSGNTIMQLPSNLLAVTIESHKVISTVETWLDRVNELSNYAGDFSGSKLNKFIGHEMNLTVEVIGELVGNTLNIHPDKTGRSDDVIAKSLFGETTSIPIQTLNRETLISQLQNYNSLIDLMSNMSSLFTDRLKKVSSTYSHLMIDKETASQTLKFISAIIRGLLYGINSTYAVVLYGYNSMHAVAKHMAYSK